MAKMEDFPLSIQELLKKRGWTWPPDEKLQKKIDEAAKRAAGSVHVDPEILREIMWEMRGIKYDERK
jgi:hypothetical protein